MRAVLRSLSLDPDPATLGSDPADFALLARAFVGPADGPGEESFDVTVCTPEWLARSAGDGFYVGRHHLVVNLHSFSTGALRAWVNATVGAARGDTWDEVAGRLARWAHWEFEDYLP